MKFVVLVGSPKGIELSATLQYLRFMQKKVPGHEYEYFEIGRDIKKIENDPSELDRLLKSVDRCDAVIWVTPVFYFLVPSQVKRFIEIIFERKKTRGFACKYATAIFTSAMVFDHTAHNYIHAISEDLGMKFYRGYSVYTLDLQKKEYREYTENFFRYFVASVETGAAINRRFMPISWKQAPYKKPPVKIVKKQADKKIIILTDHAPGTNLEKMVETFRESSKYEVEVINIVSDIKIKGPCLGCLQCMYSDDCVYKDDMKKLFDEKIIPAQAVVFAGTMVDRYLSSHWKKFFDRCFFFQHMPVYGGKESALIVSGPLRQEPNLLQIFEGYLPLSQLNAAGMVSDEDNDSKKTHALIKELAVSMDRRLETGPAYQQNFLSKGMRVILRDVVYSTSAIFPADHKYYKKHGMYDFPQNWNKAKMLNTILRVLMLIPPVKKRIVKDINKYAFMPLVNVLKKEK